MEESSLEGKLLSGKKTTSRSADFLDLRFYNSTKKALGSSCLYLGFAAIPAIFPDSLSMGDFFQSHHLMNYSKNVAIKLPSWAILSAIYFMLEPQIYQLLEGKNKVQTNTSKEVANL